MVQPSEPIRSIPRAPTRRLDERKLLALAADRLQEYLSEVPNPRYDTGTQNLIRDLRILAGQR
jgi:hypothetical protein